MVTLVGDPSLDCTRISLKAMLKTIRKEKGGIRIEINRMEKELEGYDKKHTVGSGEEIPAYLAPVIQQHYVVFDEPRGLPP